MASPIAARIENLSHKLRGIACKYYIPGLETDDIYQGMIQAFLERAQEDPTFADQNDAYLCQYAKWSVAHVLEANQTYLRWVEEEDFFEVQGEETSSFEFIACKDLDPAELAEIHEAEKVLKKTLKKLSNKNQIVVKLLYSGYTKAEIAEHLKISRPAVSQHINTIRRALTPLILTGALMELCHICRTDFKK